MGHILEILACKTFVITCMQLLLFRLNDLFSKILLAHLLLGKIKIVACQLVDFTRTNSHFLKPFNNLDRMMEMSPSAWLQRRGKDNRKFGYVNYRQTLTYIVWVIVSLTY